MSLVFVFAGLGMWLGWRRHKRTLARRRTQELCRLIDEAAALAVEDRLEDGIRIVRDQRFGAVTNEGAVVAVMRYEVRWYGVPRDVDVQAFMRRRRGNREGDRE